MNVGNQYPQTPSQPLQRVPHAFAFFADVWVCTSPRSPGERVRSPPLAQLPEIGFKLPNLEITQLPIFYHLASRQSKISFAIHRERETGLPSFGEKLKLEREKRKITLEQISASTKIGTRMLQALEEDKFNQLPGGIFNKGFVRAYSRCVGLDEDQTVADYLQASGDARPASVELESSEGGSHEDSARENEENLGRLEASADAPARQLPWGAFAAVLLLVALALSLWSRRQREQPRPSVPPNPTRSAVQVPAEQSSGAASPSSASPTHASPTAGSPIAGSPTVASAPSVAPKTSQDVAPAAPAATPGEFTVVIRAREDSWISITVDGETVSSELLAAGSERTVRGRKEIIVKAGNAGGIDFLFNGKKLDVGAGFGEVKTVTFGPHGIVPSAPAPPSTP
jgi:cytoskeleton protein RodZ